MEGHIGDGEGSEVDTLVDEEPVEVLKFLLVTSTCGNVTSWLQGGAGGIENGKGFFLWVERRAEQISGQLRV